MTTQSPWIGRCPYTNMSAQGAESTWTLFRGFPMPRCNHARNVVVGCTKRSLSPSCRQDRRPVCRRSCFPSSTMGDSPLTDRARIRGPADMLLASSTTRGVGLRTRPDNAATTPGQPSPSSGQGVPACRAERFGRDGARPSTSDFAGQMTRATQARQRNYGQWPSRKQCPIMFNREVHEETSMTPTVFQLRPSRPAPL